MIHSARSGDDHAGGSVVGGDVVGQVVAGDGPAGGGLAKRVEISNELDGNGPTKQH